MSHTKVLKSILFTKQILGRQIPKPYATADNSLIKRKIKKPCITKCQDFENYDEAYFSDPVEKQKKEIYCYGCGVEIQTEDKDRIGYIVPEKFKTKQKHKQFDQLLCQRCVQLTQGEMIPAVRESFLPYDQWSVEGDAIKVPEGLISADDLRIKLKNEVRSKKVLIVYLVDLLDIPGSFLNTIRNVIGQNPIVLVGTKFDLLPKNTSQSEVLSWLSDYATSKRLTILDIHIVSSKANLGIRKAMSSVKIHRRGRDVYIMGLANVGKSAFVRALLKEMTNMRSLNFDAAAFSNTKFLPVESRMPGTTLGMIKIQAFSDKKTIYDTPGIHVSHRLTHLLSPNEMKQVHPYKRLKPYIPPTPLDLSLLRDSVDIPSSESIDIPKTITATYYWGGLVRIDILEAPPSITLIFYGPTTLTVYPFPLAESDESLRLVPGDFLDMEAYPTSLDSGTSNISREPAVAGLKPDFGDINEYDPYEDLKNISFNYDESEKVKVVPFKSIDMSKDQNTNFINSDTEKGDEEIEEIEYFGKESVRARGGLRLAREFEIPVFGVTESVCDISVSGLLGWVSIIIPRIYGTRNKGNLVGRVWAPKGVEAFIRRPLPVPNPLLKETSNL